jgi:hypothetical protein
MRITGKLGHYKVRTTDAKMQTKKQEKLTPLISDDLRSRVRPENLIDIYIKIKKRKWSQNTAC